MSLGDKEQKTPPPPYQHRFDDEHSSSRNSILTQMNHIIQKLSA